ncbi:MAG: ABC transporter ATP-binding protein [Clostridia bacterium]|nr:ABC transporter ATP-binding protein [Clostridia bacterium]
MKSQLIQILKQNKIKLIIEGIDLVLFGYLLTCPAKYLGIIIDLLNDIESNKNQIIKNVIYIIVASVVVILVRLIFKKIEFGLECKVRKMLTDNLYKKIMKMKIEDIKQIKNGEIMSYFVRDIKKVSRYVLKFYSAGIRVIANITIVIILMTKSSNIKLALCASIPIFITIITLIFIRKQIKNNFKKSQKAFTQFSEYVQENTDSIRTVKAFSGEEIEKNNFEEKNTQLKNSNLKVTYFEGLLDVMINIGIGISYAIAILWGSKLVVSGEMTVGDIVSFMGYLALLELPMQFIPWVVSRFDELKISMDRLDKIFNMPEEKITLEKPKNERIRGNIKFNDLTFHYPDSLDEVLSDISIEIKEGETLGIIGVIGSGKTTLMNLLLKLYNVQRGKITIGEKDINDIPTELLRESICYITQDNFLFSTSLKENINLFKNEYKDEEIAESTKNAMIYDEIKEMKDGLYTIIGEKGIDLSGGQKQRVVLSRAFLNNSDIVIFDDTFSALDNRTEQHVLNNIRKLIKNKTCIIISNRISDIKDCDKIIVLEKGKIIEKGTHETLLEEEGTYYKFYESQAHKVEELA